MARRKYLVKQISLSEIREPRPGLRSNVWLEGLKDLAASLKRVGVLHPIIVKPTKDGYEIVAGHRRFLAAKMARLSTIPTIILDDTSRETDLIALHENLYREELNPLDRARYFVHLMEKYDWTHADLAKHIARDPSYVSQHMMLLHAAPEVQEALEDGTISYSVGVELAGCKDHDTARILLYHTVRSGATVAQVRQWRRDRESITEHLPPPQSTATDDQGEPDHKPPVKVQCDLCKKRYDLDLIRYYNVCGDCIAIYRAAEHLVEEHHESMEGTRAENRPPPGRPEDHPEVDDHPPKG